jgi:hypothetical protein
MGEPGLAVADNVPQGVGTAVRLASFLGPRRNPNRTVRRSWASLRRSNLYRCAWLDRLVGAPLGAICRLRSRQPAATLLGESACQRAGVGGVAARSAGRQPDLFRRAAAQPGATGTEPFLIHLGVSGWAKIPNGAAVVPGRHGGIPQEQATGSGCWHSPPQHLFP